MVIYRRLFFRKIRTTLIQNIDLFQSQKPGNSFDKETLTAQDCCSVLGRWLAANATGKILIDVLSMPHSKGLKRASLGTRYPYRTLDVSEV